MNLEKDVLSRLLRYAQIDTQSDENSTSYPSSAGQWDLLRLLDRELRELGLEDVGIDEFGYVTATLPGTMSRGDGDMQVVPVVGLLAHVDTTPEVSGSGVCPHVVHDYIGGPIVLVGDATQVISADETPHLHECIGHDIVSSDGTTLLGADDKAGVAEIMTALSHLVSHPEWRHGTVRVAFIPDEETGRGTEHFDVSAFGAHYAYTIDGDNPGEIEDETFCADTAVVTFHGRNVHPGYAKGKLVNAIKLAATLLERLPQDGLSPETTEGREGYLHPFSIEGDSETARLSFYVRDFEVGGLAEKEHYLRRLANEIEVSEPRAKVDVVVSESYRNTKDVLQRHPQVVANGEEAMRRAGLRPKRTLNRGGTDGCRLSFMGLPTANIFAGGQNIHSKREWVSVQDMSKAVEVLVHLVQVWAE